MRGAGIAGLVFVAAGAAPLKERRVFLDGECPLEGGGYDDRLEMARTLVDGGVAKDLERAEACLREAASISRQDLPRGPWGAYAGPWTPTPGAE
ncbi:hypothetical protein M885DRAFT_532360 [Pelagophyceae sp. CCMP2097]|nr:hypothetical protein M885DRAFT_532360 [Pelagophyceae sp. CCMP2097]